MFKDVLSKEQPHLLLVDEDESFTYMMTRAITRRGIRVFTANTSADALNTIEHEVIDYAILDLKISGESGLTLLSKLLSIKPEMRVLILTGYASIATAVEAIKRGACNYLCKPADIEDILVALMKTSHEVDDQVPLSTMPMSVERLQWEYIQRILNDYDGNISATARALGMHRRTLQRKLQKRPVRR